MSFERTAGPPSPMLFFSVVSAYQSSRALKGALDLGLFTAIGEAGEAGADAASVASRIGATPRGVRILCDYMVTLGFLTKQGHIYRLTSDSAAFLDRRSPAYLGDATRFMLSPLLTAHFDDIAACARKGGTVTSESGSTEPEHPMWIDFAAGMAPLMRLPAELMARLTGVAEMPECRILDIAAGHGMFGIAFARANPRAEVVAMDWANVLELARANARAAGIEARYHTLPGSAFEVDFGGGYDLVLLTNFFHHFDAPTCEALMRKVHAALRPGGRAVTLEFVPNEDRITPHEAARFALVMLASTPAGDAYTFAEYDRMFRNAGFAKSTLHPLPPTFSQVVISEK